MTLRIPTGISDFRELREHDFEFVDKSQLITQLLDRPGEKVVLLPRPRRFGKTINLTMLRWFFEKSDENLWHLFEDLHVARAGDQYRAHFQQYPVIFVSFKGTKADTFEACLGKSSSFSSKCTSRISTFSKESSIRRTLSNSVQSWMAQQTN